MIFKSFGTLRYSVGENFYKLIVEADEGISKYYRSLVPKSIYFRPQKYPAHISVVRREIPDLKESWGKYEGHTVEFSYENIVRFGQVYMWINCFSSQLENIRVELGLPVHDQFTIPPEGFKKCFHMTLGNFKEGNQNEN